MAKAKRSSPHSADRLSVALTGQGGSLLLKNGRVVNVFSGEVHPADVLVLDDEIVSVGEEYPGAEQVIDCAGRVILPGLIDGHIHLESSLLHPAELARALVRHGTTAVIADPHEIANVLGERGVDFMLRATEGLPLDVFLMAPSCVPATMMETAGAALDARAIARLLAEPRVLGLAEVMNFPGVITGVPEVRAKLAAARKAGKLIDGHAPGLRGSSLQAYVGAGVGSDHECTTREEAREKVRAGMRLMVREGSAARNMAALLPIVTAANSRRAFFVTDDKHPGELVREGHMDAALRRAVAMGLDAVSAVQMASLNTAEYFGLPRRGAVAPGFKADLVVVDNLELFSVRHVVKAGQPVVIDGELKVEVASYRNPAVLKTLRPAALTGRDFVIKARAGEVRVIRLIPDQIVTHNWVTEPKRERGQVVADIDRDILKLAVIERHHRTGNIGLGLVAGFELKKGALAASVAHDAHNVIVVGTNDKDMLAAVKRLVALGGGFVAAARGKVVAELALPLAGLMSLKPAEAVAAELDQMVKVSHNWGSRLHNPFAALSFVALPVIPELKLTDHGLVDVNQFKTVPLWVE
jgi:adenine deaminase